MLEGRVIRIEVWPKVVLEVLADLEDHDTVKRDRLATAALHTELSGVDLPYEVSIEGGGGCWRAPVLRGSAGEAVALDVEECDGDASGGGGLVRCR